jgi:cytidylate kinase
MSGNGDKRNVRIALSGKSGCGNTTVSRMLAAALGLRFVNFTFRSLAEERRLSLKEVIDRAALDDSWDREVDDRQVRLARGEGGCVLGSRLAIWMLPEADLKVYLRASPAERVRRIMKREGGDREAVETFTEERDRRDRERYMRIYGIDNDEYEFADLVIDTDNLTPEEICGRIIACIEERQKK